MKEHQVDLQKVKNKLKETPDQFDKPKRVERVTF